MLYYTLTRILIIIKVISWESKGLSSESIVTPDNNLLQRLNGTYWNSNFCLVFKGSCLKQDRAFLISKNIINIYIAYELDAWSGDLNTVFTLKDCTKNANSDEYVYSGFVIRFDSCSEFALPDGNVGRNVIVFGVSMSSSVHIDNEEKYILILAKGPIQYLDAATLKTETKYSISQDHIETFA